MQFELTLRVLDHKQAVLPLNYQYEISAWIYRVLANANQAYATFLHEQGYLTGRKSFKLFCFSNLNVPEYKIQGDRMQIHSEHVYLRISFYLDKASEQFVHGLFQDQRLSIGDTLSKVHFEVQGIDMKIPQLPTQGKVVIRTASPIVIGRKREGTGKEDYLSPLEPDYGELLFYNLLGKYRAATGQEPPTWWDASRFGFKCLHDNPRSQLVAIKVGKPEQTRVRGFRFDFELDAPSELVELGLLAGFGRYNGEGFGCGVVK
jgi:CRISPR-associated endoribonuclease Cas6